MKSCRFLKIISITVTVLVTHLIAPKQQSSFGKTHFIVGVDSKHVRLSQKRGRLKRSLCSAGHDSPITQAFFSPDDDMRGILLDLIACEQEAVYVAAFLLTDEVVARALVEAKDRGVAVEVVTDRFCCKGRHGKVDLLSDKGINVLVYVGQYSTNKNMSDIMHHKFIIFKKNLFGRSILWTGSFNFTHSARLRNQENVLILDNMQLIDRYLKQFAVLKTRCRHYQKNLFKRKARRLAQKTTKGTWQRSLPNQDRIFI